MSALTLTRLRRGLAGWLAAGVVVSVATLTWFGYRAVRGWQESAAELAQRRASDTANLLVTALTRDMRGVQTIVLSSPRTDEFMLDPPYDVRALAASAFARYPYPESFFAWRAVPSPDSLVFFDRVERRPAWVTAAVGTSRFPVVVEHYPDVARALIGRIGSDAAERRRFSTFELQLGGVSYHVVARLLYRDALREHLAGVFGFTVNLPWVRQRYFHDLTRQVARINDAGRGLSLSVLDERGRQVAGVPGGVTRGATVRRPFPMVFFDPLVAEHGAPSGLPRLSGTVEVSPGDDAIRYSGDARWIGIDARRDGDMCVIEVRDRGIGIPQGELAHVMRKFFRGRRTGSGGSGLGLAIVSRIVTDHGGRIAIQSIVGAGTTVRVMLPLMPLSSHRRSCSFNRKRTQGTHG